MYTTLHMTSQLRDTLKKEANEMGFTMTEYAVRTIVRKVQGGQEDIFLQIHLDKINKLCDKLNPEVEELDVLQQRKEKTPAEEKRRERLIASIKRYQHQIGKHLQELPA